MRKLTAYKTYLIYSCLCAAFFSLIFTVSQVYQVEIIHLSPMQLILAGTTFEITNFVCEIPTGVVADIYSRRLSIIIGTALIGLGFVIQGIFPNYIAVLVSQVFWGIGSTFTSGAVEAWISSENRSGNLNSIYLKGAQVGQIGSLFGIILSTILGNYSISLPICLGGGMLISLSLFLVVFMPEYHFSSAAPEQMNSFGKMFFTFKAGLKIIKAKNILMMMMLIALFNGLASEGYDRLNAAHFLKDTALPKLWNLKPVTWFGIFGALGMLISSFVMQVVIKKQKGRDNNKSIGMLLIINLIYMLSMMIFGLTKNFGIMLSAYLSINALKSINRPIMNALLSIHIDENVRATVLSTNGQINSLGEMIGGPIIGIIADKYSIGVGITTTVIFLIPVSIIFLKLKMGVKKYVSLNN